MKTNIINQQFAHTTVNVSAIRRYLSSDPGYLASSYECGDSEHRKSVANHADFFEFHLRRYLAGYPKTLHRVFMEVRAFSAFDEPEARLLIPLLMDEVKRILLLNEWYELMPRYDTARHRIQQRFGL